jgi:DNA helicase-2/ATP-dependent DNA helicase PcrA
MKYLDALNPEQKKAVLHIEGPLLVVAGAGTGKTKTLTHRVLHLIKNGVAPYNILAITFTNKAAREMQERIKSMLETDDSLPMIATFHALGVRILRQFHEKIKVNKYFNILDSQDRMSLIKQVMKKLDYDPKMWDPKKIASAISREKSNKHTAATYQVNNNPLSAVVKIVWEHYEVLKRQEQSLDFDDLLLESYHLLRNNQDVLDYYRGRWKYIHVDEYQDTNTLQNEMVKMLAGESMNVCAVGDADQNIYSWRGADMKNILHFEKDFPGARTIVLETNYRSTQTILQVSSDIIKKNKERIDKKLITENPEGEKVIVFEGFSAYEEANWIAKKTQQYINDGVPMKEIAVLFRTNFQSRILEEAFLRYMIPYHVVGVKFFGRKEIKDLMSYLKAALNPESLADVKRIINEPKRGIGKVSIAKIFAGQENELGAKARNSYQSFQKVLENIREYSEVHPPSETIKFIIEHSGLDAALKKGSADDLDRLENMKELVTFAQTYDDRDEPFSDFLEDVALLSDNDSGGKDGGTSDTVKLMTIHAAKGLEFKKVFVAGLEQGLFPSQRDEKQTSYEREEERRLCYVAFTRAKETLHLSYAKLRTIYGQQSINEPSEFLRDLDSAFLEYDETSSCGNDDDSDTTTEYLIF